MDWQRLKKAVRYLALYEQPIEKFNVVALSDSDWAGDLRSRRSTTGAVIKAGEHTILVKGTSQKIVALSSCESEFYGTRRTATHAEFVRGVMAFWGFEARKVKLMVDSSAAKAMSERKGVGANRHVQARYLWLQDKVFNKELEVGKVAGKVNDADLVTKVQPRATIHAHLQRLGFEKSGREGRQGLT